MTRILKARHKTLF